MCSITKLDKSYLVYTFYNDLLNSYVSDYYVEDHWRKLPKSWQNSCGDISMDELSELLDFSKPIKSKIYSLSLLSLRCVITNNVLPRKQTFPVYSFPNFENDKISNLFWKNVKLKKRHEISVLAELCYKSALNTNCFCIVDIGSGVGHLSRLLAYKYGFKVCTFESNNMLTNSAKKLDDAFKESLIKYKINYEHFIQPVHINKMITHNLDMPNFINDIENALKQKGPLKFGIVGLHPCGDLSPILLTLFNKCAEAVFINIASCCYMKLSLTPPVMGFPLSKYCQEKNWTLSYLSCEIACHAIENYVNKLKTDDFIQLKVHAYRAAFEKLLISYNPKLKHSCISSVKYTDKLTFKEYCLKTIEKFNLSIPDVTFISHEHLINNTWHKVVVFYSLRLLLAPLVENIILLDRMLFLSENGHVSEIIPAFDCNISPRNFVIRSIKNKNI